MKVEMKELRNAAKIAAMFPKNWTITQLIECIDTASLINQELEEEIGNLKTELGVTDA